MAQLLMLKKALISYVTNSAKAVWSAISYPLSIISTRSGKLKDYHIYGNTIQDGEPAPDNPIEMQSVGELVTEGEYEGKYRIGVVARGKNMLKAPLDVSSWGKQETSKYSYKLNGILPINETVTLSFDYTTLPAYFYFLTDDESIRSGATNENLRTVYLATDRLVNKKLTFTPKEGKSYYLYSALGANNSSATAAQAWLDRFTYMQIEYGNEATEYEEYKEPQTFDIYLNEPLRKVEGYEDYIDFEKGVVVRSLKERALTGNENWYREAFRVYCFAEKSSSDGNKMLCISNRFVPYSWEKLYQNSFLATKNVGIAQQSGGVIVITPSQDIPSVEDWKAQLKAWNDEENPLTVIYYVNPTEEEVELPKLPQYKGTTVYEVDATIKPSGIKVFYYE